MIASFILYILCVNIDTPTLIKTFSGRIENLKPRFIFLSSTFNFSKSSFYPFSYTFEKW